MINTIQSEPRIKDIIVNAVRLGDIKTNEDLNIFVQENIKDCWNVSLDKDDKTYLVILSAAAYESEGRVKEDIIELLDQDIEHHPVGTKHILIDLAGIQADIKKEGEMKTFTFNYEIHCHLDDRVERNETASYNTTDEGKAYMMFLADVPEITSTYYKDYEPTFEASEYRDSLDRANESAIDLSDVATPQQIKSWNEEMADINILLVV